MRYKKSIGRSSINIFQPMKQSQNFAYQETRNMKTYSKVVTVSAVCGIVYVAFSLTEITPFSQLFVGVNRRKIGRQLEQEEGYQEQEQNATDPYMPYKSLRQRESSRSLEANLEPKIKSQWFAVKVVENPNLLSNAMLKPPKTTTTELSLHFSPVIYDDITNTVKELRKRDKGPMDTLELIRSTNKTVIGLSRSFTTEKFGFGASVRSELTSKANHKRTRNNETKYKSSDALIPNVVHYVWFGERTFSFLQYLSFLSVSRFLKPDYIFIHGDAIPREGIWLDRARAEVPNIYFVKINKRVAAPNGQPFKHIEHAADVERIVTTLTYGGIYLDTDILAVKSFDHLRYKYSMVMGRETPTGINSGIIMARRGEPFLSLWLECYRSYLGMNEGWAEKATFVPHHLSTIYPHLIHIEERSLNHPSWREDEIKLLFEGHYDWSRNYAIHVWGRSKYSKIPYRFEEIDTLDTTLGEIIRHIYYGSKELRQNAQDNYNSYK